MTIARRLRDRVALDQDGGQPDDGAAGGSCVTHLLAADRQFGNKPEHQQRKDADDSEEPHHHRFAIKSAPTTRSDFS